MILRVLSLPLSSIAVDLAGNLIVQSNYNAQQASFQGAGFMYKISSFTFTDNHMQKAIKFCQTFDHHKI